MDTNEDSIVLLNSVKGIENVRPPTLDFLKLKDKSFELECSFDND